MDVTNLPYLESLLAEGHHLEPACRAAGVSLEVVQELMQYGEAGDGPEDAVMWGKRLLRAMAEGEISLARAWLRHAGRDWRAAETWLSRRYPQRYHADAALGESTPITLKLNVVRKERK